MASCTVRIFSASSSGISMSKASSNAMTSSTVSSESAPRSSTKEALLVTSPSSTPSCSTMICFTFSSTAAIRSPRQRTRGRALVLIGLLADLGMLFDVVDGVLDGADLLRVLVGNLEVEILFQRHDQLHGIERVGAQVVNEGGAGCDLGFFHAQLLCDDLPHLLGNFLRLIACRHKSPPSAKAAMETISVMACRRMCKASADHAGDRAAQAAPRACYLRPKPGSMQQNRCVGGRLGRGVLVAQAGLPAGHRDLLAADEHALDVGLDVERVAAGHDDIGHFAGIERAQLAGHAPDLSGVQRDGLESFLGGKTEAGGESRLVRQVAGVVRIEGGEGDFDAPLVQFRRQAVDRVEALILPGRLVDGADDDGNLEAGDVIEHRARVADRVEHELEIVHAGQADGSLEVAGIFGSQHDRILALKVS